MGWKTGGVSGRSGLASVDASNRKSGRSSTLLGVEDPGGLGVGLGLPTREGTGLGMGLVLGHGFGVEMGDGGGVGLGQGLPHGLEFGLGLGLGHGLAFGLKLGLGLELGLLLILWMVKSMGRGPRRRLLGLPEGDWVSAGRLDPRLPPPALPLDPMRSTSASSTIMDIFCKMEDHVSNFS